MAKEKACFVSSRGPKVGNRQMDQCNQIEQPDIDLHTHVHVIFDKKDKIIQWKKERIFNKW